MAPLLITVNLLPNSGHPPTNTLNSTMGLRNTDTSRVHLRVPIISTPPMDSHLNHSSSSSNNNNKDMVKAPRALPCLSK